VKEEQQFPRNINIINEIRIKTATKRIRSSRGVIPELGNVPSVQKLHAVTTSTGSGIPE